MIDAISKTNQLKEVFMKDIKKGLYKPGDKLPSILSICKKYNVSKPTVSQALSNLNELGMIDIAHGKTTRVSEAPFQKNIVIVYNTISPIEQQDFWTEFYMGMVDEINATPSFSFSLYRASSTESLEESKLFELKNSVGALVVGSINQQVYDRLKQYGMAFLLVYNKLDIDKTSCVFCDYQKIMQEIVDLFIKNNRTQIAYIGYYKEDFPGINTNKYNCFLEAMRKRGLSVNPILHRAASHDALHTSYEAIQSLLKANEQPNGVFLSSDALAPGVYRALYDANLTMPEDVMVASCDNLEISKYMIPSLTSIELSRYKMGRIAARNLIFNIQNGDKAIQTKFSPELIIRESLS